MDGSARLHGRQEDAGHQLLDLLQEPFSAQVRLTTYQHEFRTLLTLRFLASSCLAILSFGYLDSHHTRYRHHIFDLATLPPGHLRPQVETCRREARTAAYRKGPVVVDHDTVAYQ